MFSKACEYAIKVMIYIAGAEKNGEKIGLKQIAGATASPEPFTAKILQQLVKNKLLVSFKGPAGGFQLIEEKDVTINDIVEAIDGPDILEKCVLGLIDCSNEKPCPVHDRYVPIREQLRKTLLSADIRDKDFRTNRLI